MVEGTMTTSAPCTFVIRKVDRMCEWDGRQHKGFYKAFYINQLVKPILVLFRTGHFITKRSYRSSRTMTELNEVKRSDMKRESLN